MATTTTNLPTAGASVWSRIGAFFSGLYLGLAMAGESSTRVNQISKLNAMSDEKLAEIGIRREDIVRYVFRDTLFL